jgi:hypothetical protein
MLVENWMMPKNKGRIVRPYGLWHSRSHLYFFSAQEIATLRKEAQAFKAVRDALRSSDSTVDAAKLVFQKVLPPIFPLKF